MGATILRFCPATGVSREGRSGSSQNRSGRYPLRDRGERRGFLRAARGPSGSRPMAWPHRGRMRSMGRTSTVIFRRGARGAPTGPGCRRAKSCRFCAMCRMSPYLPEGRKRTGFNLGPYDGPCQAHWARPRRPRCPRISSFQLLSRRPLDAVCRVQDRILDGARARLLSARRGWAKVINGARSPYAA